MLEYWGCQQCQQPTLNNTGYCSAVCERTDEETE